MNTLVIEGIGDKLTITHREGNRTISRFYYANFPPFSNSKQLYFVNDNMTTLLAINNLLRGIIYWCDKKDKKRIISSLLENYENLYIEDDIVLLNVTRYANLKYYLSEKTYKEFDYYVTLYGDDTNKFEISSKSVIDIEDKELDLIHEWFTENSEDLEVESWKDSAGRHIRISYSTNSDDFLEKSGEEKLSEIKKEIWKPLIVAMNFINWYELQ